MNSFIVYGKYEYELPDIFWYVKRVKVLKLIVDIENNITKINKLQIRYNKSIQDLERIFDV